MIGQTSIGAAPFGAGSQVSGSPTVTVTGVSSPAVLGDQTVSASGPTSVTGILGLGFFGMSSIGASAPTSAAASPDTTVTTGSVFSVTAVGNESISLSHTVTVTGVSSQGLIGDEAASGTAPNATVTASGVSSFSVIGTASVHSDTPVTVTSSGTSAGSEIGSLTLSATASVTVSGVSSQGLIGDEQTQVPDPDATVSVSGVNSGGAVGIGMVVTQDEAPVITGGTTGRTQRRGRKNVTWSSSGLGPGWQHAELPGPKPIDISELLRVDARVEAMGVECPSLVGPVIVKARFSTSITVMGVFSTGFTGIADPFGAQNPTEDELMAAAERFGLL